MSSMELLASLLACVFIIKVHGQLSGQLRHAVKSGSCPPSVCVSVFENGCQSDFTCPREMKCCDNQCGKQMCMPPISSEERRSKQEKLHVSFVQETTTITDQCYYNGQWYSPGQSLINRDGAHCTCINRERISCTRPNIERNNNIYHNNQGQSNSVQSNFRMAPSAWQSQGGFTSPAYQWRPQTTLQPVQVVIQDVNKILMGGQSQYGLNLAMNGYRNLGEVAGTQSPAFLQASHVKEAQAHSVITGQNPYGSAHRQQMLYDKNYPSIDKSASLHSGAHKSEMNGQFGFSGPYMSGNVNFGLPSKNEGNILRGPITTEISIVKDPGMIEMQQSGQGVTKVNQGFRTTTTSWLQNTGVSKNIIESLEFGVLERQAGQQLIPKNENSIQNQIQNRGYAEQQRSLNPGSALNPNQINSFNQDPIQTNPLSTNGDIMNVNSQRPNNSKNQFQANKSEFQQQINMPSANVVPDRAPYQLGTSGSQEPYQQLSKGQNLNQQMANINQPKSFQNNATNGFFGFSKNIRMEEKVNVPASFGSFGSISSERNINGQPVNRNGNPNLGTLQQAYQMDNQNYPILDNSRQRNPMYLNNNQNSRTPQQADPIAHNNNRNFRIQQQDRPINGNNYGNSGIPHQANPINNYNNPYSGMQQNNNNNPNLAIPQQYYSNNRHSNSYFGIPQQNNPTDKNINHSQENIPMHRANFPQTGIAHKPSQERSNVFQGQNLQTEFMKRDNKQEQNTGIQLINTKGNQGAKPNGNAAFNADNLLVNQEKTNQVLDNLGTKSFSKSFNLHSNTGSENKRTKFVYNKEQSNNKYKVISFENMHSEKDLKSFNRQQSRVTPFSLKGESIQMENSIQNPEGLQAGSQTQATTTIFPKINNIKIRSDTQKPFEEIIIETTLPPATSTKSFIQFLKEVLEQREMVKSKVESSPIEIVYNKEMVKSKKEVHPPTNPVYRTKKSQTSTFKIGSPSITTAKTPSTPTETTTASSSISSSAVVTTVSSVNPTLNRIPTTITEAKEITKTASKIIPTTDKNTIEIKETDSKQNTAVKSRPLTSLLAEIDKHTTVRIKVVPTQNASPDTRQTYVVYMSPSPKESRHESTTTTIANIPMTTFTYVNNHNQHHIEIKDNPTMSEPKEPRIQIMTESTTLPMTSMIEKPTTTLMSERPGQKSQGTTNSHYSHFQFTDTATQRMDVVDQSKDIPINNPSTTMSIPMVSVTSQQLYKETPIVYTSDSPAQNAAPAAPLVTQTNTAQKKDHPKLNTLHRFVPDILPENATFYEKIVFMRRQKEARENPVAALKKYGSQSNMLHLINMLPKNNYNPMAAKNVAEFYTVKDRPRLKTTVTRASTTTPSPLKKERKHNNPPSGDIQPSKQNANMRMTKNGKTEVVQNSASRAKMVTRSNRNNQVQPSQKTQTRQRVQDIKKSPAKTSKPNPLNNKRLKQKLNNKQCVYLGKIYKINQRFRNNRGQRCKCRKGGKIKCRR
ncbi:uncharacterized protein LOC133199241 [Saccostrea echinata]|uniref:uncharacterized protein LOC133199241 n=1 Tax=Saccostrea echinata TaxID=191078 RepID=UPI002A835A5C|nr:uncharacterized protein LOC133199241 [Saccostrea echinata]